MADKNKRNVIEVETLVNSLKPLPERVTSAWLSQQLMGFIADGRLPSGTTLPAERALAINLEVSRGTITRTMEQLYEHGMLESKRGSGHRVTRPMQSDRPTEALLPRSEPATGESIDLRWTVIPPHPLVQECATRAATGIATITSLGTSPVQGVPALIDAICEHYTNRGLPTRPEQIVVTNGVVSGLHLSLIAATRPQELVGVENPIYPNITRVVNTQHRRVCPFPFDAPDVLTSVMQSGALGAAIITPDFHNPTGRTLSQDQRNKLLHAARVSDTPLIIDESLTALNWQNKPLPAPMAADGVKTYLVGGTSKSLWAGLRVGWIRTSRRAADMLAHIRLGVDLGAPMIEQLMAADLLRRVGTSSPAHAEFLAAQHSTLIDALATHLPHWKPMIASGGLSLWCTGLVRPAVELVQHAREYGVELLPGPLFSPTGRDWTHAMRLPFTIPARDIKNAVEVLGKLDRL